MNTLQILIIAFGIVFMVAGCKSDRVPPEVIASFPERGATNVDASITEIWVQFNEPMMENSWSWCYEAMGRFPETYGKPRYEENNTKNVLPVQLKPNTAYVIWINMNQYNNFRDQSGNPLKPWRFPFETGPGGQEEK